MINEEKLNQINANASQRCSAALSKLINTQIEVVFSNPMVVNVKEASPLIGSQELGAGVYLPISGDVTGSGLFLFPKETSFILCDLAVKKESRIIRELSSFDEGILKEIGNILLGNYLTIVSNSLKAEITGGMPNFSSGMFGAILEGVVIDFNKGIFEALVIKIELTIKDVNLKGYLLLIFRPETIEALLGEL